MPLHPATVGPLSPWASLPNAVQLLYVTTLSHPASWVRELFSSDRAMVVTVEEAVGGAAGLARLRKQSFDALLVRHAPPDFEALEFIEAHRATGVDEPLVVIGNEPSEQFAPLCYEVGADAYVPAEAASPRQMIWVVGRSIEWRRLVRENRRLVQLQRHQIRLEHCEAERLLVQQRGLIAGLEELTQTTALAAPPAGPLSAAVGASPPADLPLELPDSLVARYGDLLRAYVIMGSGHLTTETAGLVSTLCSLNLPAPQVMQLHLHALEETLRGLGSRSSRHVMARADLLVLEIMVQLAERH